MTCFTLFKNYLVYYNSLKRTIEGLALLTSLYIEDVFVVGWIRRSLPVLQPSVDTGVEEWQLTQPDTSRHQRIIGRSAHDTEASPTRSDRWVHVEESNRCLVRCSWCNTLHNRRHWKGVESIWVYPDGYELEQSKMQPTCWKSGHECWKHGRGNWRLQRTGGWWSSGQYFRLHLYHDERSQCWIQSRFQL